MHNTDAPYVLAVCGSRGAHPLLAPMAVQGGPDGPVQAPVVVLAAYAPPAAQDAAANQPMPQERPR
jgi:hypothetical protein